MADLTPDDAIKQGLELYKSLYNQTHDKEGRPNDVKVTSLFLVQKGKTGLEFVDKRSLKGVWTAIKDRLCTLAGVEGPLDAAKNLARAQEIFNKVQGCNDPRLTDKQSEVKRNLNELASEVIQLQQSFSEATTKTMPKIDIRLPFGDVQQRVVKATQVSFDEVGRLVVKAYPDLFTPQELKIIQAALIADPDCSAIVDDLNKPLPDIGRFEAALRKAVANASRDRLAVLSSCLDKIGPHAIHHDETDVEFNQFMTVFGDAISTGEADISTQECAQLVNEFIATSPEANRLKSSLEPLSRAVDLANPQTRQEAAEAIKAQLKREGRCFIHAGGTMCEASAQKNGKITFSVYNQKEPDLHNQLIDPYRTRRQPCLELSNIDAERFLRPSFLQALAGSSQEGVKAEVIAMLDGKPTTLDKTTQRLLSSTRSGAPSYRSYLAAASHCMSPQEFRAFKCNFKVFMYERYCTWLEAQVNAPMNYAEARKIYACSNAAKEKFAASIDKLRFVLPLEAEAIRASNDRMQAALNRLEAKIVALESEQKAEMTLPVAAEVKTIALQPEETGVAQDGIALASAAVVLPRKISVLSQQIQALDNPTAVQVLDCFDAILQAAAADDEMNILALFEELLKKLGGIEGLLTFSYDDPILAQKAFDVYTSYLSFTTNCLDDYTYAADARRYVLYLAGLAVFEKAFTSLDKSKSLVGDTFASILGLVDDKKLSQLSSTAPFLAEQLVYASTLVAAAKDDAKESFPKWNLHDAEPVDLSHDCKLAIMQWFNAQPELKAKLAAEVADVPRLQQEQIDKETAEPNKRIKEATDNLRLANLLLSQKPLTEEEKEYVRACHEEAKSTSSSYMNYSQCADRSEQDRQREIFSLACKREELTEWLLPEEYRNVLAHLIGAKSPQEKLSKAKEYATDAKETVDKYKQIISQVPTKVYSDIKYWPKNFNSCSDLEKAIVILGLRPKWIPREFRKFLIASTVASSTFFKSADPDDGVFSFKYTADFFHLARPDKTKKPTPTSAFVLNPEPAGFTRSKYLTNKAIHNQFRAAIRLGDAASPLKKIYDEGFILATAEEDVPTIPTDNLPNYHKELAIFERARELFQIHSSSEARIEALVSYLYQHADVLQDENYFALFCSLLFESDLLLQQMQQPAMRTQAVALLKEFFAISITSCLQLEDYKQAAKLAWLAKKIQNQVDYTTEKQHAPAEERLITLELLTSLIEKSASKKYSSQQPAIYSYILACSHDLLSNSAKTDEEKKLLAFLLLLEPIRKQLEGPRADVDKLVEGDLELARPLLHKFISQHQAPSEVALMLNTESCRTFLASMFPRLGTVSFEAENGILYGVQNGKRILSLDLSRQELICTEADRIQASLVRVSNADLKLLVAHNIMQAKAEAGHLQSTTLGPDTFITDPARKIVIKINSETIEMAGEAGAKSKSKVVQTVWIKNEGSDWKRVVDQKAASDSALLNNKELGSKYIVAYAGEVLELLDPTTLTCVYKTEQRADGSCLLVSQNSPKRILAEMPPNSPFATFEAVDCTSYWADEAGDLQQIDFTRLGLTLVKEGGQWVLANDRDWHIAPDQILAHFGHTTGFLLLENSKGQKKALVPVWDTASGSEYSYAFASETVRHARCVEYDVVHNKPIAKTVEGRYQLARIYLAKGFVDEAQVLLASPLAEKTTGPLSGDEEAILEAIVALKSTSIRSITLQMRALYLLEKNAAQFLDEDRANDERSYQNKETLEPLLQAYFRTLGRNVPLARQDELFLIQRLHTHLERMQKVTAIRAVELGGEALVVTYKDEFEQADFKTKLAMKVMPFFKKTAMIFKMALNSLKPKDYADISALLLGGEVEPLSGSEKMQYRMMRMKNKFPFKDELHPTLDEVSRYKDLLLRECTKTKWNSGCKNGLVPFLFHMAQFNQDEKCREFAAKLLEVIQLTTSPEKLKYDLEEIEQFEKLKKLKVSRKTTAITPKLPPSYAVLQRGAQELLSVGYIEASRDVAPFLQGLCNNYVTKTTNPLVEASSNPLTVYTDLSVARGDPARIKALQEANKDLEAAKNQLDEELFTWKDGMDAGSMIGPVKDALAKEEETLQELEMYLVGSVTAALTASPSSQNQFTAKKRTLPSIEEICYMTSRKDFVALAQKHYPELVQADLDKLQTAAGEYLKQKQQVQHLRRTLAQIDEYLECGDPQTQQTLLNQLGKTLEQKSAYDLHHENARLFLQLETSLNIILRKDQVENITNFANKLKNNEPCALQMIMGAGKTSVLQPALALLLSDSNSLSGVVVPEALLEPVREGLVQLLGSAYQQFVVWMPYNRSLAQDVDYLKTFHSALVDAKEKGATVIFTPRQLHSIITSSNEVSYALKHLSSSGDKELIQDLKARLECINSIIKLLKESAVLQMDEADTIMNPKINFKYPVGDRGQINTARGIAVTTLMLNLAQDKELSQALSLDFLNQFQARSTNAPQAGTIGITPEVFATILKPKLVQHAKSALIKQVPSIAQLDDPNDYIGKFLAQSTPNDKDMIAWLKEHIPSADDRNVLGVLAHSINNVLSSSLFKKCGMHYGSTTKKGDFLACPYEAADSPKPTMFSDPYEQLIYAMQNVLYNGITKEATCAVITHLQQEAKKEMQSSLCPLASTEAFARFTSLMGDESLKYSFTEDPPSMRFVTAMQAKINSNPQELLAFAKEQIFTQIAVFTSSISSTPQSIAALCKVTGAYTGTLQPGILPKGMDAKPELGTDGKTILTVLTKIEKGTSSIEGLALKDGALPGQVIERFATDPDLHVFIDSGGWLKDERIDTYAERMLTQVSKARPEIQAVCYIDSKGAKISVEYGNDGKLIHVLLAKSRFKTQSGHHITIIPQKYETGTNIPQKPTAKAYLSVRKNMTSRDALQSIFRMRQILLKQNIVIGLSEEVQEEIKSQITAFTKDAPGKYPVSPNDLFRYFTMNMAESVKEKNWIAAQHRMREVLEKPLQLLRIDESLSEEVRNSLFDKLEALVVQQIRDEPFEAMCSSGTYIDAQTAIDQQVHRILNFYDSIQSDKKLAPLVNAKIQEVYGGDKTAREALEGQLRGCVDKSDIPQQLSGSQNDQGQELEVEAEKEAEEEEEIQVEFAAAKPKGKAKIVPYSPLVSSVNQFFTRRFNPIQKVLPSGVKLPDGKSLEYSSNLFRNHHKIGSNGHALYRLPESYLLAIGTGQEKRFVLVSLEDLARIKKHMLEPGRKSPNELVIYSLDAKVLASTSPEAPQTFSQEVERMAVQAKLCAGKISFSKKEIETLKTMIDEQPNPKAYANSLRKMLESTIQYLDRSKTQYQGSAIKQLFMSY